MKTIKNETLKVSTTQQNGTIIEVEKDYKEQILVCLNFETGEGMDYEGIKVRNKIEAVLEKSNGSIDLEDHDADALKEIVRKVRWITRDKGLQTFIETINDL